MKKISIIAPVFNNVLRIFKVNAELVNYFKDKYNFEVFYYYKGDLQNNPHDDYHFNYLKIVDNQSFNDCVVDGFNRADGDCVIIADLNNSDYQDYLTKMLVEWEAKAQVVLVKKNIKTGFWDKIKNFFVNIGHKIYDLLLSFVGLNADFCAYKNFQLFSREVAEVIKSFPEKNYYLRNFDCWVDYRVSILYTNNKIKVKNKTKIFTKDFAYCLSAFALMLSSIVLVAVGKSAVPQTNVATFILIGVGLTVCLGAFAIFCLYRWFVYKKTLLKINMK